MSTYGDGSPREPANSSQDHGHCALCDEIETHLRALVAAVDALMAAQAGYTTAPSVLLDRVRQCADAAREAPDGERE